VLQPEQIVASFLSHLRKTVIDPARENDDRSGNDCYVLSVPHYYTDSERAALLDAADISKFKVMAVVNDLTASALAYGYFQRDLPTPLPAGIPVTGPSEPTPTQQLLTERPRLVIFVDFGHGGLRTALVEFTSAGMKMLGRAGDRQVGGRHFDERLAKYFMDKFNAQHSRRIGARQIVPLTMENDRKAYAKMLTSAEKTKRLLSANKESVPVNLECLHNDLDLSCHISRQEFEELCGDLFERVRGCLSELIMNVPDMDLSDLHSVEVIGGSSRIPKFKTIIEEIFGMTSSTTLHATESSAKGCALMCAALTRIYSVKPFQVFDLATPYNIQLKYTSLLDSENTEETNPTVEPRQEVITQTVFKSDDTKYNEVVVLRGRPQGDTLAIEYDDTNCTILKRNLIAIYQLQFTGDNAVVGENDDLMLQMCINNNGMPRLRKCKLIKRDINGGETEVDVKFTETRFGGLSEKDIGQLVQSEENMQKRDNEEEKRQEVKNSLEESTFQFKDDLSSSDNGLKEQAAWKDCMSFVDDLQNHIDNDENYENWTIDEYERQSHAVQDKSVAYRKWKTDYKIYMENKKVQQINDKHSKHGSRGNRVTNANSRPKTSPVNYHATHSPLFSELLPTHDRNLFLSNWDNGWNQYYGTPQCRFPILF